MKENCFKETLKRDFKNIGTCALLICAIGIAGVVGWLGAVAVNACIIPIVIPIVLPHITGYNCYIVASCAAILIGVFISLTTNDSDDCKSLSDASAMSCLMGTELLLAGIYTYTVMWANPQWFYVPMSVGDVVYLPPLMAAPTIEWIAFSLAALVIITVVTAYARCRD